MDGAQEEKVSYIAWEHIAYDSHMKFVMMEFILATDKKVNRFVFGKNVQDLLQEDHNLSNTTIMQYNKHEQYWFGIWCNP